MWSFIKWTIHIWICLLFIFMTVMGDISWSVKLNLSTPEGSYHACMMTASPWFDTSAASSLWQPEIYAYEHDEVRPHVNSAWVRKDWSAGISVKTVLIGIWLKWCGSKSVQQTTVKSVTLLQLILMYKYLEPQYLSKNVGLTGIAYNLCASKMFLSDLVLQRLF